MIATVSQVETANENVLIEALETLQGETLNALDCIPKWQSPGNSDTFGQRSYRTHAQVTPLSKCHAKLP
jgi:hypothetical protein